MNITFSIQRFYALFLRYWAEYKITLLLLMMLSVSIVYFYETGNGRIKLGSGFINGGLSVFMIIFLYYAFRCVDNKKRLAYFLLLPSTGLEKFLFLIVAGFLLPYLLIITELYIVKTVLHFGPYNLSLPLENVGNVTYFNSLPTFLSTSFSYSVIITFRFLQKQSGIFRSFYVLVAGVLILTIVNNFIVLKLFGPSFKSIPFGSLKFEIGDKALVDAGLYTDFLPYSAVLFGCFWAAMVYVAFMKFREMEKGL